MNNWINIDEKWPNGAETPLILVACPAFNEEGKFLHNDYHVVKFDSVDEFEGEIWKDSMLDEVFDVRGEAAYWQPIPGAPESKQSV